MSTINTLENGRAKRAYEFVEEAIKKLSDPQDPNKAVTKKQKEYKSWCKKVPVLIKINGLGQTVAFLQSKDEIYQLIYNQISHWLREQNLLPKDKNLMKYLTESDKFEYRQATSEALALLGWMRRFADGLIEGENNGR